MEWQPIETYDALKVKPAFAAFYVKAHVNILRPEGTLMETVVTQRHYGCREVTLWTPLPPPPVDQR